MFGFSAAISYKDSSFTHAHTFLLALFVISYLYFRDLKTRAWLAVISRCGIWLIQTPLSLYRSIMTMQRSSGRTRVCGPAGKGLTNINSLTAHSSKSLFFWPLSFFCPPPYIHLQLHIHIFLRAHTSAGRHKDKLPFSICSFIHTHVYSTKHSACTLWGVCMFAMWLMWVQGVKVHEVTINIDIYNSWTL